MRIYDARFKYTPAINTNIASTWKKFGFKPTTESERLARQRRAFEDEPDDAGAGASITQFDSARRVRGGPLRLARNKSAGAE
ncbi:MAG TPA: hypothetical protein VM164_00910 [Burkholderiales bacterium]|nr:hypothetical protein [Burkholderiales bacterium]